jgi:hypothetical protein
MTNDFYAFMFFAPTALAALILFDFIRSGLRND